MGLDYSFKSLAIAKSNFCSQIGDKSFGGLCCDGRNVSIRDNSVDAIAAVDFTEHLDDAMLVPTLAEAYRIIRPGGRLVIYTPNPAHLFEQLKKRNIILKEDVSHIGLRTMSEYCTLLKNAGFVLKTMFYRPTDIPVFNLVETILMGMPGLGSFAKRRICIAAEKTA